MSNHPIGIVFQKEILEMFRDKRVRSSALFAPAFIVVVLMVAFGFVFGAIGKAENQEIHYVRTSSQLLEPLRKAKVKLIEVASVEEGRKRIEEGKAKLVLAVRDPLPNNPQGVIEAYFDPKETRARIGLSLIQGVYGAINKATVAEVFKQRGIPPALQEPIKVQEREVKVGEQGSASELLVTLLPYMIIIYAFFGAISIASEMVAGEKEKNTLETLLISPVQRTQIVLGKLFALATISLLSSISAVAGLYIASVVPLPGTKEIFKTGVGVSPTAALTIVGLMVPTAVLFASLLLAVSSYARNTREAQQHLAQVSLVVTLPAVFSQFIGLTGLGSATWLHAIPILNTANNIRLALLGKVDLVGVAITIAISVLLALAALRLTVTLFNREQVLVRV